MMKKSKGWIIRLERSGRDKEMVHHFNYTLDPVLFFLLAYVKPM
jgi:hypothetical protein